MRYALVGVTKKPSISCLSGRAHPQFQAHICKTGLLLFKGHSHICIFNPYPTAFPYGNGMVLHFYQQQESSTTKTVHKVINKGLKAYV